MKQTISSALCAALVFVTFTTGTTQAQVAGIAPAGVEVDAAGVLRMRSFPDPTGRLTRQRIAEMRAALNADVARPSKQRKISLTRLEKVISERFEKGAGLTEEMRYLAGLTAIEHVYLYPETGDIVIAGPAEGYGLDLSGRPIGLNSGQSLIELQDLVAALRAFPPSGESTPMIGCSIDPTQEGLQKMQQFLVDISGRLTPNDDKRVAVGLKNSLGPQRVTIEGISPKSHFAQVLVEADYRMKLIGIGLENPPIKMNTYIKKARPADVSRNAMQRWYFVPDYEAIRVATDNQTMQLVGGGVKLVGQKEMVAGDGGRSRAKYIDRASAAFTNSFTEKFDQIARRSPVFGQLRNLVDLAITAAFIQDRDYYGKANWSMDHFADEEKFPLEVYNTPTTVESAVNVVWRGNTLMTPIGGGVSIQPSKALTSDNMDRDEDGKLEDQHDALKLKLADGQWWWD